MKVLSLFLISRCDAFLVNVEHIRVIRLPMLMQTEVESNARRFLDAVESSGRRYRDTSRRELSKVMEWLWDTAVQPALTELGIVKIPATNEPWPRVWWVGSGLFNILPIHAAGYHDEIPARSAIDLAISSYTPTVKSLAYVRERAIRVKGDITQKAVIVGMPNTPDHVDLPSVEREIRGLQKLMPKGISTILLTNTTRPEVLAHLPDTQLVHMACHGFSSMTDPSQSRLLLTDWQTAPLTVSDLGALNTLMPQFAYLSACHTASTRDFKLLDESIINLASAVQLSGYASVIGTLWYAFDEHSADVTCDVYNQMLQEEKVDTAKAAEALHFVTRELREKTRITPGFIRKTPSNPLVWASYIHIGI